MKKQLALIFLFILLTIGSADATVRVIYFTPNDRPVQWAIPTALDTQMKTVQTFYAEQMSAHGYGGKTFKLETGTNGSVVVHHYAGKYSDSYYHTDTLQKVHTEIKTRFDTETDVYAVFVDISAERVNGNCGIAYFEGGPAMFPATGECVTGDAGVDLIAHELGHAFNLEHDFRDDTYIMSYGSDRNQLSKYGAEYLNVSPFFNGKIPTADTPATIEMLSDATYTTESPDWTLRFSVNDPDGVYQVQLLHALPNTTAGILGCQSFDHTQTAIVLFPMPDGATLNDAHNIWLRVVDTNGYLQTKEWILKSEGSEIEPITQNADRTMTYLTLGYDSPDALIPTNPSAEWAGWREHVWERKPNSGLPLRPNGFMNPQQSTQYYYDWEYFFYSHAVSRIVYDLSKGHYMRFETIFDMPNPCGSIASLEILFFADDIEIYNSGLLRGSQARNTEIGFDLPQNIQNLTIEVSDGGDGNGCDHFILAEARLLHSQKMTTPENYPDVNRDGVVNLVDLVIVAVRYGEIITGDPTPNPDVNRDGIVDVNDLILVTNEMPVGSAPEAQLLQTQLLPNYPNPLNPETWIPYQLAEPANAVILIHAVDGSLIRRLDLGYQDSGLYVGKHQAAYWDGRNEYGEPVASGVYFYTLTTDKFTATQKMIVTK